MKTRRLQFALRLIFLLVFGVILARLIDFQQLQNALKEVKLPLLLAAIGLYVVNIAIRAYRFAWLSNTRIQRLTFTDAYVLMLIGIALNILIPATLGDLAKTYYGYRIYGLKEELLSSTLVDKLLAFCALFLLGAVSGFYLGYPRLSLIALAGCLLLALPLFFPAWLPWRQLDRLLRALHLNCDMVKLAEAFQVSLRVKITLLLISVGGWWWTCFYFYVLCLAFAIPVKLGYILVIMPLMSVARLFPFTVNALGPTEIAVAYFFSLIGIEATRAVLISLLSNIISSILPGLIGFGLILTRGHRVPPRTS